MILPTKHMTVNYSLLGVGALILSRLNQPRTVSAMWEEFRGYPEISTYERFTLGLDLLFMINAIELYEGKLRKLQT